MNITKHTTIFCLLLALCGCTNEGLLPEAVNYTVVTQPAENIFNRSASLGLEVSNDSYYGKKYIDISSKADMNDSKQYECISSEIIIRDLQTNTQYYYQGVIQDKLGNQIKGDVLNFRTLNEMFSISSNGSKQTFSESKLQYIEGIWYNYGFNYNIYARLVNNDNVKSWGIVWLGDYHAFSGCDEGYQMMGLSIVTVRFNGTFSYKIYAQFTDGSYRYSQDYTLSYLYKK